MSWLLAIAAYETAWAVHRHSRRKALFARASSLASADGRTLVVVGDPKSGAHTRLMPAYGCGDVTIDLHGAPSCPRSISADITSRGSIPVPRGHAVVFVSCVLEYVDDIAAAWAEIMRAAGDDAHVFVVRVEPWTVTSRLFTGAKWVIDSAPPYGPFKYRRISGVFAGDGH